MEWIDDQLTKEPRRGERLPQFEEADVRVIESPTLDGVAIVRVIYEINEMSVMYWNIWVGKIPDYGIL